MKFNYLSYLLSVVATAILFVGCIKENKDDCSSIFNLTVKAYAANGSELTGADVGDVVLYVFDKDLCYLQEIQTTLGQIVEIEDAAGAGLNIVAWGNICGGSQPRPVLQAGDHKSTAFVRLALDSRALPDPCMSPNDLFHGQLTIAGNDPQDEKIIPIHRKVGSMAVTVRELQEYSGFADNNFRIEVRETGNTFDFNAVCSGTGTCYRPTTAFTGLEFKAESFNMIPGNDLNIDIFHGNDLVYTATLTGTSPINVEADKLTNVLIDLSGSISVSVSVSDWGQAEVWKNF